MFFKTRTGFCRVSTFSQPVVILVYVICWNNEYILDNSSGIGVQKVYKKTILTFVITLPRDKGITNLFYYIIMSLLRNLTDS